jgi:LuxR family maltose regulon positive regulatory protein
MPEQLAEPVEAPLLRSKLAVPPPPAGLVHRPRLYELLDAGARGPVTVLGAPAGWGKTVLLSSWVREVRAGPVAWLTVEPCDEGERFWRYLCAALFSPDDAISPGGSVSPGGLDLTRLADALARRTEPVVVILDDFHHVRDPEVLHGLEFILRHAPQAVRLVVASRTEPALALHRWRVRDEVAEVRAGELSFTVAETEQVLACDGLTLPAGQLAELQARTEGWPAGVRLATKALSRHPDPARYAAQLSGDDPPVADYLVAEVLADQPGDVRELLLDTSILERISVESVEAIAGRTGGERLFAALRAANGYVIPLDAQRHTYRHHRMFGELLRAELHRQCPEKVPELHRRAARWNAEHGLHRNALRHALAAQDWGYATGVFANAWHQLVDYGHEDGSHTQVPPPPPEALASDPELALAYAADRLDLHGLDSVADYLVLATNNEHLLPIERRDRFALMSAAFRLTQAQLRGQPEAVLSAAGALLALAERGLDGERGPGAERTAGARAIAYTAAGGAHLGAGELDAARESLAQGLACAERAGLACPRLACAGRLAFIQALRGALRTAERDAQAVVAAPPCPGQARAMHTGYAHLALAVVQLEWDRLDEAAACLHAAATCAELATDPALDAWLHLVRARLHLERGELAGGYQEVLAGRRSVGEWRPPRLEHWFAWVEAELRVAHGDTEAARKLLEPLPGETAVPLAAVPLARAYLRDDAPGAAVRTLATWVDGDGAPVSAARAVAPGADGGAPPPSPADAAPLSPPVGPLLAQPAGPPAPADVPLLAQRLEAGLIKALAERRTGDTRRAIRTLERVLELAEPEGFRRVFTRVGAPVHEALLEHLDTGTAYWSLAAELIAATGTAQATAGAPAPAGEALTERELTILRYLQSILSNVEIAAELSVSVNTVKTHVRNIYRKLHATRRRDAVRRAREMRLL